MDCRHSYHLIDAGTYVVGGINSGRCRSHLRALSTEYVHFVYREVAGQNNAYATEEADAGEWKNAAGEGIFWGK
jgi:hypothetical protein